MDIIGTVLSAAQTLLASLQCSDLQEILSIFGYKSQLDDLRRTVSAVNAVLLDAEAKQELSHEAQHRLEELKDAVFEADDLLDEFVTLAEQKQLLEAGGSLSKKVSRFFSDNPLGVAYKMSRGVKKIRKKLDSIAYNTQFSFKHDPEPIRRRRPETCSYVDAGDIIGRQDDLEKIIGMMLDSNLQRDVSFLTIVGIGGLGKTALAQLVHNDPRVTSAFPLRLWTCVSDQDQKQLDVKEIICKILASDQSHEHSTLDQVQKQLRDRLAGKKYLLVLDDVWSEKCVQWRDLERFLIGGQRGSWILVTTRSLATAKIIGDGLTYELQGLSEESSWCLFERMAFGLQSSNPADDLVNIGKEIVKGCSRVPLAIRVVGSLLYGQDKSKWLSLAQIGLANLRDSQNDIMPILKLSYHNLESPLKSCFSYCALFPKDYWIAKEMLISLWMAQGYIVPLDEGQSIEDAAEEYFSILLQRCFFQDVLRDVKNGDIVSFKIHDLMHDVAQIVTKQEIRATHNFCSNLDNKVRHLSVTRNKVERCSFHKSHIRTFLFVGQRRQVVEMEQFRAEALLANCFCLRTLDLSHLSFKTLPESIGELLHLRYLDLSWNSRLEVLPKSITKLGNLQTLNLSRCRQLKELPKDLSRLVKLRTLLTSDCRKMTCFPMGMGKLNCLHRLSDFIVGGEGSYSSTKHWLDGLEDLKAMNNLNGHLDIQFKWPKNVVKVDESRTEGHYLKNKGHLKSLKFLFCHQEVDGDVDTEEARRFMEELQPHSNLKRLDVSRYRGVRMPDWATLLPNLVRIHLEVCKELEYLPCLGSLRHLKSLWLNSLPKLEYIEISPSVFSSTPGSECAQRVSIFPSLEILRLLKLPKLKGWRGNLPLLEDNKNIQLCVFGLTIIDCPELTCIPLCPKLEYLFLKNFNKRLKILQAKRDEKIGEVPPSSVFSCDPENSSKTSTILIPTIRSVVIDNVVWLNCLPMVAFRSLESLSFEGVWCEVESLEEVEEVFRSYLSSLQTLKFERCDKLRSVCGGLEHLTALKKLVIRNCPNVRLSEETEDGRPWRSLHHSLLDLRFEGLPQLVSLPDWMQSLASLKYLFIKDCRRLESIPNWMPKLTSLNRLELFRCSESLKSRCQKDPPGEDWPYIKHIPIINFRKDFLS